MQIWTKEKEIMFNTNSVGTMVLKLSDGSNSFFDIIKKVNESFDLKKNFSKSVLAKSANVSEYFGYWNNRYEFLKLFNILWMFNLISFKVPAKFNKTSPEFSFLGTQQKEYIFSGKTLNFSSLTEFLYSIDDKEIPEKLSIMSVTNDILLMKGVLMPIFHEKAADEKVEPGKYELPELTIGYVKPGFEDVIAEWVEPQYAPYAVATAVATAAGIIKLGESTAGYAREAGDHCGQNGF